MLPAGSWWLQFLLLWLPLWPEVAWELRQSQALEKASFQSGKQSVLAGEGASGKEGWGRPSTPTALPGLGEGPLFLPLLGGRGHLGHGRRGGLRLPVSTWKPSLFAQGWRKAGVRVHASPWKQQ